MDEGFAALVAQVVPVLVLALVLEARSRRQRMGRRIAASDLSRRDRVAVLIYLWHRHALPLLALGIAEALSLLRVQGIEFGRWAAVYCIVVALAGFVALIFEPIFEMFRSTESDAFLDRLQTRPASAYRALWIVVGCVNTLGLGLIFVLFLS